MRFLSTLALASALALSMSAAKADPLAMSPNYLFPTGQVGVPYSSTLAISGGTPPYTCAMSAGSLPFGLTLKQAVPQCLISGTPSVAGTKSGIRIKATDSTGAVIYSGQWSNVTINP